MLRRRRRRRNSNHLRNMLKLWHANVTKWLLFRSFVLLLKLLMAADALPSHLIRCSNWFCLVEAENKQRRWRFANKLCVCASSFGRFFFSFYFSGFDFNLNVRNTMHARMPVDPIDSETMVRPANQKTYVLEPGAHLISWQTASHMHVRVLGNVKIGMMSA